MTAAGASARTAIAEAAGRLGHPDPIPLVDELASVDLDGLRTWSEFNTSIRRCLADGADQLGHAMPTVTRAWSSPAARESVQRHRDAGLAARDVVGRQVDAALDTLGTLGVGRTAAPAELDRTADTIVGTGWPPGEDLLTWATANGRLPVVSAAIGGLVDTVRRLRTDNDAALQTLADALRDDPAEPVDTLRATMPAAFPGASDPTPAAGPAAIDRANLDRLAADLHSADPSARQAAEGVQAALDKARTEGGTAQLLVYESASATSQGRAAISIGDITTADNVVTLAPGVSSAPATMSDGIDSVVALRDRSEQLDGSARTAVVAWYAYQVPLAVYGGSPMTPAAGIANTVTAPNDLAARSGGGELVEDLTTFHQWAPDGARFIGMGFSMGSTTVSEAAAQNAGFDDLVLLGSPGAGNDVDTAADYPNMGADHVWVISRDQDPITTGITDDLAQLFDGMGLNPLLPTPFGPDPAAADFGAQVLDVPSNAPDVQVHIGGPFGGLVDGLINDVGGLELHHKEDNYLSGPSLDAVASVVVGQTDGLALRPGR